VSGGQISIEAGAGSFDFTGGTLHVGIYNGDLTNEGGVLAPGDPMRSIPTGITQVTGNYTHADDATLQIEIGGLGGGSGYDRLVVGSTLDLNLGGTLDISIVNGFTPQPGNAFDILEWGTLTGMFDTVNRPFLGPSLDWDISQLYTTGVISIVAAALAGDFNNDGTVDAADYVVWRKTNGTLQQFNEWKANFGATLGSGASASPSPSGSVPEPSAWLVCVVGAAAISVSQRRRWAIIAG
jgi:hypothetical protein